MTGLDHILNEILQESQEKADDLIRSAKEKAAKEVEKVQQEAAAIMENNRAEIYREAEEIKERGKASAQRRLEKNMLKKKQQLIDITIDMVYQKLLSMSETAFRSFVLYHLQAFRPDDAGTIYFVKGDMISDELKEELKKRHPKFTVSKERIHADGGFLLSLSDMDLDVTYQSLIAQSKEYLRDRAAALLFETEAAQ